VPSPRVVSPELKSNILLRSTTRSPSLIRKLYPDSRVKELLLRTLRFVHGQPFSAVPVVLRHWEFVARPLYVLYTSPGLCLVSEERCPFKRGSQPQGD